MKYLLKDSSGSPSGTFSFCLVSVIVTALSIVVSLINNIKIGDFSIVFREVDTTLVLGFLSACLGSYVYRRTKSDILNSKNEIEEKTDDNK
jgi:purine-cytosine permease-like protein